MLDFVNVVRRRDILRRLFELQAAVDLVPDALVQAFRIVPRGRLPRATQKIAPAMSNEQLIGVGASNSGRVWRRSKP
jgi:hypothetical protein